MYMCVLFASISFEMCLGVVVFAGVQSLRYNYNIRHAILHEIFTFSDNKFMTVWAVATGLFLWYYISNYEIFTTLWATKHTELIRQFEQQTESDCEIIWAANAYEISEQFEQLNRGFL